LLDDCHMVEAADPHVMAQSRRTGGAGSKLSTRCLRRAGGDAGA
jgi:hypothetical protein